MSTAQSLNESQVFNLTDLAIHADRARRFRVIENNIYRAVGGALIVIGGYFFLAPPPGSIPIHSFGPLIFMFIGAVILVHGSWIVRKLGPSARRLVLTRETISLEQIPRHEAVRLDLRSRDFRLEIHDFRGIRAANPMSRSRGYEVILHPSRGPETAVPREALTAILARAEALGMHVNRREVPIGAGAPMIVTTIRPAD